MKLQDFLVPAFLAFITMWAINYFFPTKQAQEVQEVRSGQSFTPVASSQMCQPVNTEIDFYDAKLATKTVDSDVTGYHSRWLFSSQGASLDTLSFKRDLAGSEGSLTTIYPSGEKEREDRAFLVALAEMTPYDFTLVDKQDTQDGTTVTYTSVTPQVRMTKEYRVSHDRYEVDLTVTVEPLVKDTPVQPRIFFPGPWMQDVEEARNIFGMVFTARDKLEKIKPVNTIDTVWAAPKIFGAESRYFVHALVADENKFTQRAYFKLDDIDRLTAILEGPQITEKTSWKLSFYCGPKESAALAAVDKRLEGAMDYGWLAPIAKLMIWLLNWLYSYVGNYGWAIILLTILTRLIMVPFTQNVDKGKQKNKAMQKELKYIEQKYKHDREALAKAKMEVVRKYGVIPGMGSCLPMLLQIPIFIGLNYALRNSIELYKAPFIWWIQDLSAKDPYYILPTLIGLSFFLALGTQAKDPRHKVALVFVALFLGGIMANLSAGLTLYICVSGFLGFAQTKLTKQAKHA